MQTDAKFLHYREVDEEGKVLPNGGATVAYVVGENGSSYAFAYCSPCDNYSKAYGRAKSSGRLLSNDYVNVAGFTDAPSFISYMDQTMEQEGLLRR